MNPMKTDFDALRAFEVKSSSGLACLNRIETRLAELESFAFYALDHSNDPGIVANAKLVVGAA